jgi:hypothetical protein
MKVIVLVKANKDSEAGVMPSQELLTAMGKFNEELVNAGVMLSGEGLKPSSAGVRIRFAGKGHTVTKGPFTETNELVAGFWIWKVKSMQDAINWLERSPFQDAEVEIRPFHEFEDFAPNLTPELIELDKKLRAQTQQ